MQLPSDRALVLFHLGGKLLALPLDLVGKILPMAQLAHPPGLPPSLEGILNLAGSPVPVLRLARLLQLPEEPLGLYSMLLLLKSATDDKLALLVDRVSEILQLAKKDVLPVAAEDSFNGCVEGTAERRGQTVHVLSHARILLAREKESLAAFHDRERVRLEDWKPVSA